uniref:Uncharacterized protein n=1 Tax=Arundo donax TaxID=35708 RepID=A0A0A9C6Y6_ARUDO
MAWRISCSTMQYAEIFRKVAERADLWWKCNTLQCYWGHTRYCGF